MKKKLTKKQTSTIIWSEVETSAYFSIELKSIEWIQKSYEIEDFQVYNKN